MPDLVQQVQQFVAEHRLLAGLGGSTMVVAVSGGPDSVALLHVLLRIAPIYEVGLHVAHLEHGIRGEDSLADADFVAALAATWGVPFTPGSFDVPAYARAHGLSLEDAARRARYRFLGSVAAEVATPRGRLVVATGHNADDQVETTLLSFVRGAGMRGLAGMRPLARLPVGGKAGAAADELPWEPVDALLARPLLATWRRDIVCYCEEHGLDPRIDQSNFDVRYARNRVRHELVPLLEDMKPGFKRRTWHLAAVLAEEDACLESLLNMLWEEPEEGPPYSLWLAKLKTLPLALRRRALLRFARQLPTSCGPIGDRLTAAHLRAALRLTEPGTPAGARTQWPCDLMVTREGDFLVFSGPGLAEDAAAAPLYILPRPGDELIVATQGEHDLGGWRLRFSQRKAGSFSIAPAHELQQQRAAFFDAVELESLAGGGQLALRTRRPGDRFRPFGLGGRHRKLQDVFVDARVPTPWRDRYALLALPGHAGAGEVLWIPGIRRSDLAPVTPDTTRVLVVEAAPAPDH